jgi:hypothetical protein
MELASSALRPFDTLTTGKLSTGAPVAQKGLRVGFDRLSPGRVKSLDPDIKTVLEPKVE